MNKEQRIHNSKPLILFISGIFVILIVFSIGYSVTKAKLDRERRVENHNNIENNNTENNISTGTDSKSDEFIIDLYAVIADIDTVEMKIKAVDADSDELISLSYTGASDIRSIHDAVISANQLEIGDAVHIKYDSSTCIIKALKRSEGFFEYKGIKNISTSSAGQYIYVLGDTYKYTGGLVVVTGESGAGIESILKTDVVTVRGIDDKICSIVVTRGHGYVVLSNDDYFIGGNLYAGAYKTFQIEKDMMITLPEGSYDFMAEFGDYTGEKTLQVKRNNTTVFNLAAYGPEPDKKGNVVFNIEPAEAKLYIDGEEIYHYEPFELKYGLYEVKVSLGGYSSYTGKIEINKTESQYNVTLYETLASNNPSVIEPDNNNEQNSDTNNDNTNNDNTNDDNNDVGDNNSSDNNDNQIIGGDTNNDDNTSESNITVDNAHTITIKCTEDTEIYFNNEYVGIIEDGSAVVPKYIGTFNVDLYHDGYATQSFVINVPNDNENIEFTFPEF